MKDPLTYLDIWDPLVSHQIRMKCLEWRNREDVRRSMLNTHIISKEEHEAWLESLKDRGCESKVKLAFTNGGGVIGMINLHNMDFTNLTSNFGGYIGDLAYRGKGLWNFMVREIQRWAFLDFGFRRLYTEVVKDNFRAMSSYIKAGFTVEGIFREHIIRDSKPLDIYWIGMDKSQWRP